MTFALRRTAIASAVLLGTVGVSAAATHLRTAVPAPGSTVAAAPTELRFSFDGGMRPKPTGVTLTGSAGRIPLAPAALAPGDGDTLVVPIAGPLTPGSYKVDWHATGADGRKASGTYAFTIIP